MAIEVMKFDHEHAADEEYDAYNVCSNQIRRERLPDDPPIPLEETIQRFQNIPDMVDATFWVAKSADEADVVAFGGLYLPLEDNLHMAQFDVNVLPAYRRQGIGKSLMAEIVAVAQEKNRRLMIAGAMAKVPAGAAFLSEIGAEKGLETHTNQLTLADLDREIIGQWIEKAEERGHDFEIGLWEGRYPEEALDTVVELEDLLNQQPFGDLEVEDFASSPEIIQQQEDSFFARGYDRRTLYVREKATGKYAGYTEIFWHANRPDVINQGMTGVFPDFRNKGLGRWLKAEMMNMILTKHAQAKFVRTQNADSNAPMLKINVEMGFKPYIAESLWQGDTEKVAEYLAR